MEITEKSLLQNTIDIDKWLESEKVMHDKCGSYPYCKFCDKNIPYPCAEAVNKYKMHRRIRLSFVEKLAKANDEVKNAYAELCDYIISKGMKLVVSKRWVSVRKHNVTIVKMTLTGNLLKFRLSIDPNSTQFPDSKFPHLNDGDKKSYYRVPFTFKITSDLTIKRAKILFDSLCD